MDRKNDTSSSTKSTPDELFAQAAALQATASSSNQLSMNSYPMLQHQRANNGNIEDVLRLLPGFSRSIDATTAAATASTTTSRLTPYDDLLLSYNNQHNASDLLRQAASGLMMSSPSTSNSQDLQAQRILLLQKLQLKERLEKQSIASLLMNENSMADIVQRNDRDLLLEIELARAAQQQQQQQQQLLDLGNNMSPLRQLSNSTAASRMLLLEQLGMNNGGYIPNMMLDNINSNNGSNNQNAFLPVGEDSIRMSEQQKQRLEQLEKLQESIMRSPELNSTMSANILQQGKQRHDGNMKQQNGRELHESSPASPSRNQCNSSYKDHLKNSSKRRVEYMKDEEKSKAILEMKKSKQQGATTDQVAAVATTKIPNDEMDFSKTTNIQSKNGNELKITQTQVTTKSKTDEDDVMSSSSRDASATANEDNAADDININNETFPYKLYRMLVETEEANQSDIVSFLPHGCSFAIHQPKIFASEIMPKYFTTGRLSSFQRQLNLYNFRRIPDGPDKGGYWHENLMKDCPSLCQHILRRKSGTKSIHSNSMMMMDPPPSTSSSALLAAYHQDQKQTLSASLMPSQRSAASIVPLLYGSNNLTIPSNRLLLGEYFDNTSSSSTSNTIRDIIDRRGNNIQLGGNAPFVDYDNLLSNRNAISSSNHEQQQMQMLSLLLAANQTNIERPQMRSESNHHHDMALLQSLLIQQQQMQDQGKTNSNNNDAFIRREK